MGLLCRWLFCTVAMFSSGSLSAHEATMVDLRIREVAAGDFVWSWGIPAKGRPVSDDLAVSWPSHCEVRGQALRCGARGLAGTVSVDGVGRAYSAVILRVTWIGGQAQTVTLTHAMPGTRLFGGSQDALDAIEVAKTYALLGVEHILAGWDHLLFVISLLLLVGFNRRLVATVTAFTVAHSLTLAASALGWLVLRSPPVEAAIALSIVLVCGEAIRARDTLSRRWPALVALIFGLVHGLGFAGALKEIGLPDGHASIALLCFNLGVEIGQLLVIALGWLLVRGAARIPIVAGRSSERLRHALVYSTGGIGAFWLIERVAGMLS
ncbi:MAG: HupE/UreJ family protein [Betaproteobacteria bacterium]|nr:HupE/UreJ family protein [Betaproteobacteria bacterium]